MDSGDCSTNRFEMSKTNDGFEDDENILSKQGISHKDCSAIANDESSSGLNYDKLLEHIGQFGR